MKTVDASEEAVTMWLSVRGTPNGCPCSRGDDDVIVCEIKAELMPVKKSVMKIFRQL